MAITFDGFISDRNVRWALASMAIVISIGIVTFVVLRLQAVDVLQTENLRLKAEVVDLQKRIDAQMVATQERLATVEQTMFGTLVPEVASTMEPTKRPMVVLSAPAQWQVQRDRELRNRIATLEKWRIQHEDER